jgi:hypothetical protein
MCGCLNQFAHLVARHIERCTFLTKRLKDDREDKLT